MDSINRTKRAVARDVGASPWAWALVVSVASLGVGLAKGGYAPSIIGGLGLALTSQQFVSRKWTRIHHEYTKIRMKLLVRFKPRVVWYNHIIARLHVGAMPLEEKGHLQMLRQLNASVLRCCQDYELEPGWFDTPISNKRLDKAGIEYLHLKSTDHKPVTSPDVIDQGTQFIHKCVEANKPIYIHCRAGRGRSVTLLIAYLMRYKDYTFETAYDLIKSKRPHICLAPDQQKRIEACLSEIAVL